MEDSVQLQLLGLFNPIIMDISPLCISRPWEDLDLQLEKHQGLWVV